MRDIRPDLRERLAAVNERYGDENAEFERERKLLEQRYKARLEALARERAALEQLLVVESDRAGIKGPTLAQRIATLVPLGDFLTKKVELHGPMGKEQLRAEAKLAGYSADSDGRTFHITLMNITKSGRVTRLPDGRYAAPAGEPAMFDQPKEGEVQTLM